MSSSHRPSRNAAVGIVVDVVRATSSIAQALAAATSVLCCREIEEANRLRRSSATRRSWAASGREWSCPA
jgi:phosphosulfolactate phosphohydrolase-like enzyme